jgi:SAM-dependent methyltransferase
MVPTRARSLVNILRRSWRAYRRHGLRGALRDAVQIVTRRKQRREAARRDLAFDREHGVETAGIIRLDELPFESGNKLHGIRYEPITPEAFHGVLYRIDLGDRDLTFVDLGSGKGRAVLLASLYPFRRVIGVEFSPELTEVARRNVQRFRHSGQRCSEIELLCVDAADYEFPTDPLLVYSYNSFERPLMQRVLAKLGASGATHKRRLLLVTVNRSFPLDDIEAVGFRAVDAKNDVFEFART